MNKQEAIFKKGEGNRWFARNKDKRCFPENAKNDWIFKIIKKAKLRAKNILDIGGSNGWLLAEIQKQQKAKGLVVDPSLKAIKEGRKIFPKLVFRRGLMSKLPISEKEKFDLVIINEVFHWIDRGSLLKSISEADRVLKWGGWAIITDCLPDNPAKVPYHHLPGKDVFTYKLDYPKIFLATGFYKLVSKVIFEYETGLVKKNISSDHRGACFLLQKSSDICKLKSLP